MSPTRKIALSLIFSAILAAAAIFFVGTRQTLDALWQTGPTAFLTAGIALYLLMACQAAAWARLERQLGDNPRARTLLASTIVAMAGNVLMPSAHLGGEPAKILYAARNTGIRLPRLTGTVLLCKYIEALSFVLFFAITTTASLIGLREHLLQGPALPIGITLILLTALALILSTIVCLALQRRWTPLTALLTLAARLFHKFLTRLVFRKFFNRISTLLKRLAKRTLHTELWASRVFRQERRAVPAAFLWYLLTHLLLFLRPFTFFYFGWHIGLSISQLSLLFLAGQLMLAIQFMPSGIGTLDAGILGIAALTHMPLTTPQCTAFLLTVRFWDATTVATGLALATRTGIRLFRQPKS